MKIYIIYAGPAGEQFIENLAYHGFESEIVYIYNLQPEMIEKEHPDQPNVLEELWEEPERYVPRSLPIVECDLLLVFDIHPLLGDLIPPIAERLRAKAVLYPLDDRERIPSSLKAIKDSLESLRVHYEFPKPYCTLEGSDNPYISQLCSKMGRPKLHIELDEARGVIKRIEVLRDTPCGSARSVAQKLLSYPYHDPVTLKEKIMQEHSNEGNEHYCLASMDPLEPLMQEAGDLLVEAFFEAIGLPTLGDRLLEELERRDLVELKELKSLLVNELKLCDAPRTVERHLERLQTQGLIKMIEGRVKLLHRTAS
jgi:hypothetical protein